MTGMVAVSASLSLHAKGKIGRYTHIVLNATLLALFSWQALSGVQIIQNILSVAQEGVGSTSTLRALCAT